MKKSDLQAEIDLTVDNHADECLDFLRTYLSYDATNPDLGKNENPTLCHKWLAEKLQSLGIFDAVEYWDHEDTYSNVVAVKEGRSKDHPIFFCGHTDTVPVTDEQKKAWRKDAGPYDGVVTENKIWGRGATDMKGGNAAAIMAVKILSDLHITPQNSIYLGFVMTEESGKRAYGVDSIVERGYSSPHCIVMEPTNLKIVPAVQGEFYFRITIKGKSSHIASRHLSIYPHGYSVETIPGVNAIDLMHGLIDSIKGMETQMGLFQNHSLMMPGATTINISEISSKGIFSALAEECSIVGSMIYSPSLSQDAAVKEFENCIQRFAESHFWLREHPPEVEIPYFLSQKPPIDIPLDNEICAKLTDSLKAFDREVQYDAMVSTSDANYLVDHGVTPITFGPGASYMGMHGYNEHIPVDDYLTAIKVLAYMLTL